MGDVEELQEPLRMELKLKLGGDPLQEVRRVPLGLEYIDPRAIEILRTVVELVPETIHVRTRFSRWRSTGTPSRS